LGSENLARETLDSGKRRIWKDREELWGMQRSKSRSRQGLKETDETEEWLVKEKVTKKRLFKK